MSPATAIWIGGEALMLCAGVFAATVIGRDLRKAWPLIKQIWRDK